MESHNRSEARETFAVKDKFGTAFRTMLTKLENRGLTFVEHDGILSNIFDVTAPQPLIDLIHERIATLGVDIFERE